MKLNQPQSLAHQALEQQEVSVCLPWGRGVGKSWFQRFFWYLLVAEWDGRQRTDALTPFTGVRIVHSMPTLKQIKAVHGQAMERELNEEWAFLGAKIDHTNWRVTFPGGSWIQWFGTSAGAATARGIRADAGTYDELDDIEPDFVDAVATPWFSEPWSLQLELGGGTPRRGRHGLLYRQHRAGLEGAELRARGADPATIADKDERERVETQLRSYSFHATYRDAPENVDARFVARTRSRISAETFRREWECDFDTAEGLVYGLFRENFHVRAPDPRIRWSEILVGVDHGWTDPGVFLVIGVAGSGESLVLHVLEEVYETEQVEGWWNAKAKALLAKYATLGFVGSNAPTWYADPSRPDRVNALRGVGCRMAREVDNSLQPGISAVQDRLAMRAPAKAIHGKHGEAGGEGPDMCPACLAIGTYCDACRRTHFRAGLYVSLSCKNTIREFLNYRRKRSRIDPDHYFEEPEDKNNHAMDGARYAVVTRFGRPQPARGVGSRSLGML